MIRSFAPMACALAIVLNLDAPAGATTTVFTGTLDGPTAGADSPATGQATLTLDEVTGLVHYEISYSNLQGEEFVAHLHAGAQGAFGPIVHHLPLGTPKIGIWEPTARRRAELLAGNVSVMIHTDLFPEGEIGGWVTADGAPVRARTWSAIKRLLD
jgi:hypothetical protein